MSTKQKASLCSFFPNSCLGIKNTVWNVTGWVKFGGMKQGLVYFYFYQRPLLKKMSPFPCALLLRAFRSEICHRNVAIKDCDCSIWQMLSWILYSKVVHAGFKPGQRHIRAYLMKYNVLNIEGKTTKISTLSQRH